jgi:hypothetical protein
VDTWLQLVLTSVASVLGSSGLWAYIRSRDTRRSATTRLMMGLAYDRITTLGIKYLERGSITMDEVGDFRKYLYEPYKILGGNGAAEQIMLRVQRLPLRSHGSYPEIFRNNNEGWSNNVRLVIRPEQDSPPE